MTNWWTMPVGWIWLTIAAMMWGVTNPAIKRASSSSSSSQQATEAAGATQQAAASTAASPSSSPPSLLRLLLRIRFLLPFAVNQCGSLVYLHALSLLPLSLAVPAVNALTLVITAITAAAMGENTGMNNKSECAAQCSAVVAQR